MADTDTADAPTGPIGEVNGGPPQIRILAQFIRDLSFENPRAPESLRPTGAQPQIDIGVELAARARMDDLFEVDIKFTATAKHEAESIFQIELLYGGLFQINGVPEEAMEQVLLIECPRFMFPFVRKVVSDLTSEGGFPPFMLDPIDFAAIYAARQNQIAGETVGQA
jgi:preprotein translocase subunit SecB